jgi:hypothetical protein
MLGQTDRSLVALWLVTALSCPACGGSTSAEDPSSESRVSNTDQTQSDETNDTANESNEAASGSSAGDTATDPEGSDQEASSSDDESSADLATQSAGASSDVYAHVKEVNTSGADGAYTFSVTVESADIDCSQFADWWEVLSEDGQLRYRRVLLHSHTDENGTSDPDAPGNTFTRSGGPVDIEADETVLVRAHMNEAGYNGDVMRGSVSGGFAPAPDIDSSFAADVETQEPLAGECQF